MRRSDREITDFQELITVMRGCGLPLIIRIFKKITSAQILSQTAKSRNQMVAALHSTGANRS